MAKLIYGMGQCSLDGYVAEADGNFNWLTPGEDLHLHAAAELRAAGTAIYGRKLYELMVYWETADQLPGAEAADVEFAKSWQAPEKVVVSKTLGVPMSAYTIGENADVVDPEQRWPAAYGVAPDGAVLVRPDGHVAWRQPSSVSDPERAIESALRTILGRA